MANLPTPDEIEAAVHELFAPLDRLAPGSADSTLRALSMVPNLDTRTRAIELGCGCGSASLTLAPLLPGKLVCVDIHEPFIARLRERAGELGLGDRIDARVADMREPGVDPRSCDLVWAEGSLYNIGFWEGLGLCRRLLAPGGVMAVSELVWLRERPNAEARAFWAEHYPKMLEHATIVADLRAHDLVVHSEFVLPRADWEGYYEPLRQRAAALSGRSDPGMRAALENLAREIDIFERHGDEVGYVFLVAGESSRPRACLRIAPTPSPRRSAGPTDR